MTYEAKIRNIRPQRGPEGEVIGFSPSYLQGFHQALEEAAKLARKADLHIDMLRKMLLYVHQKGGIDGWVDVANDRYEYASEAAKENGREEPNTEDEINGILMMLRDAMHEELADDEIGIGVTSDNAPDYGAACACGARPASACPGAWEPGCDLGANAKHARPAPGGDELEKKLNNAMGFRWMLRPGVALAGRSIRITDAQYNRLDEDTKGLYEPI